MDAMTHGQWIGVTWLVIKWAIGLGLFGIAVASAFCEIAKRNLVQEDECGQRRDPMVEDKTSIFDEEFSDCETVISDTVVRA